MRSPTVYALSLCLVVPSIPKRAFARQASVDAVGTYVGVQVEPASLGADEASSRATLAVDAAGVSLGVSHDAGGRPWVVRYPAHWLETRVIDGAKRIDVRQSAFGHAFAFALVFDARARTARAVRPDGTVLAEFVRAGARTQPTRVARLSAELHARHHRPRPPVGDNVATDLMHQGSEANASKLAWLEHVKAGYRDYDEALVARVLPLVARALAESDPAVRTAGLAVLARLPRAEAVTSLLELARTPRLDAATVDALIRTLGYYLHEANQVGAERAALRERFGTDDPAAAYDRLGGVVGIGDTVGHLAITLDRPARRAWRRDHATRLRGELVALTRRAPTSGLRALAEATLEAWEPDCVAWLGTGRTL